MFKIKDGSKLELQTIEIINICVNEENIIDKQRMKKMRLEVRMKKISLEVVAVALVIATW